MNFLCAAVCTTPFFDKTDVTVLCLVALIFDRDDLNCVFGHVDLLTPYKTTFPKANIKCNVFFLNEETDMFTGYYHSSAEMGHREKEIMH